MNDNTASGLFTDFYELTMAQGYWQREMAEPVVFDYFFRRNPFYGGYSVFAGLGTLLENLKGYGFSQKDLEYLDSLKVFKKEFLDYLGGFSFKGTIHAAREGEVIFPQEPVLRVESDLIQAQIVEGIILNVLNFQSLIATKSARVWLASNRGKVMEFGLRRAQGRDGAFSASRAAFIGGAYGTSNSLAGMKFGIPVLGTMAHSWVLSFPSELESFQAYAEIYPNATTFLIDTYNSLESGIGNAIVVGKELRKKGLSFGVRLDSGDIDYLTREVRSRLDQEGFHDAKIVVSNELDEEIIEHLVGAKAPIDVWGVGTNLVTGGSESAFTGVYKLSVLGTDNAQKAVMKFSDNPEKSTNPGKKDIYRFYDDNGISQLDLIALADEEIKAGKEYTVHHPSTDWRQLKIVPSKVEPLLQKVMENGETSVPQPSIFDAHFHFEARIHEFDPTFLRLLNPHVYKVSITSRLKDLKLSLIHKYYRSQAHRKSGKTT
jgi:nicotinate phosphoribosyltransferase